MQSKGEILIYESPETGLDIQVRFEDETLWLSQRMMAELFDKDPDTIGLHIKTIFSDGELNEKSVSSILEHTARDGKNYKTQYYNLDAIISVGYRVNSKSATRFRVWATQTLKNHLVKGYTLNEKAIVTIAIGTMAA